MTETALLLLGYNRPQNLQARLLEISRNEPVPLIVSIDGGDSIDRKTAMNLIDDFKVRNPEFETRLILRTQNLGLAKHITTAISEVFDCFDYCIVVEDDISIGENFVKNMINGQVAFARNNAFTLGGFSPISKHHQLWSRKNRFRETVYFSAWGWMTSAEKWKFYRMEIYPYSNFAELTNSETWRCLSSYKQRIWCRRFLKVSKENPSTWDFQMQYATFTNNFTHLLPIYKFCDNLGFNDPLSTHTTGKRPRWMGPEGRIDRRPLTSQNVISRKKILGRVLMFFDSIFIAGDSEIVKIHHFLKRFMKLDE
jgi:hypothetical protein